MSLFILMDTQLRGWRSCSGHRRWCPRPNFNAHSEMIGRVGFGELAGGGEVGGFEEQQRGNWPRVFSDTIAVLGAGPDYVRCEDARFELVASGVLGARPSGDFLLAAGEVGFGKWPWPLTEEDDELFHFDSRLNVGCEYDEYGKKIE